MDKIRNYLAGNKKSYSEGIDLLKKHSKNKKETDFLASQKEPLPMHEKMMLKRLHNILRIAGQNQKTQTEEKQEIAPIIIQKTHFSKAKTGELTKTKELTNKLLAREWSELDEKEQAYFKKNEKLFAHKKELLFRNSAIESELKSLHASLEHIEDDERKEVAEKLVTLKKEQNDNWAKIDNFNFVPEEKKELNPDDKAELLKSRNNLRSYVSKLEKQVNNEPRHKNHKQRVAKLKKAKDELKEIDDKIAE